MHPFLASTCPTNRNNCSSSVHPFQVAAFSNDGNQSYNSSYLRYSTVKESIGGAHPVCYLSSGPSACSVIESASTGCNLCLSFAISASLQAIFLSCLARHSQLFHQTSLIQAFLYVTGFEKSHLPRTIINL